MLTRYRADHVGSLLRPAELLRARAAHQEGRLSLDELRKVEDREILDALALQREVGVDVLTDGEYRRSTWATDMHEAVEGFGSDSVIMKWRGPGAPHSDVAAGKIVTGKLRQARRLTAHEVAFLKSHAPGPFKMTVPSPSVSMHLSYKPGVTDKVYATREDMLRDVVQIVRTEITALVDEGVPYIQLDAPLYTHYADPVLREGMRQVGMDPERALDSAIAADNACLEGARREGVMFGMHMCRANYRGWWVAEGGYDPIAEKLFGAMQVDAFLLEYDSERAGGFEPLRFVPRGKTVVLGLISTKVPQLESPAELRRRIEEASKYVPLEHLALSPQCGFASRPPGNPLSVDDQRRKLELVVSTAREVWG